MSHVVQTSARCTFPMSVGGGAVTTASSRRNESSPTGHGRLTSISTSLTGAPHLFQPTGHWREQSRWHLWYRRRHDWCWDEENALEIHVRRTEDEGTLASRASRPLKESIRHEVGKRNCYHRWRLSRVDPAGHVLWTLLQLHHCSFSSAFCLLRWTNSKSFISFWNLVKWGYTRRPHQHTLHSQCMPCLTVDPLGLCAYVWVCKHMFTREITEGTDLSLSSPQSLCWMKDL